MNLRKYLSLAVLSFTSAVSIAAPLQVGDVVNGNILEMQRDGGDPFATVPLIDGGKWTVEANYVYISTNTQKSAFRHTNLIQTDGDRVLSSIEAGEKVDSSFIKQSNEPCKVDNVYYKNNYNSSVWKQKCLVISPVTWLQNTNQYSSSVLADLNKRGIKNDFNAIRISYTRYGDVNKFLSYSLFIFPSNYGLENPLAANMNASPWASSIYTNDPQKVKFIEAVKAYAETMVNDLDAAYETGQAVGPLKALAFQK